MYDSGTTINISTVVRKNAANRNCSGKSLDKFPAELPARMLSTKTAANIVNKMLSSAVETVVALSAAETWRNKG